VAKLAKKELIIIIGSKTQTNTLFIVCQREDLPSTAKLENKAYYHPISSICKEILKLILLNLKILDKMD